MTSESSFDTHYSQPPSSEATSSTDETDPPVALKTKPSPVTRVSITLTSQPGWPVSGYRDESGVVRVGYFGSSSARIVRECEIQSIRDRQPDLDE